MNWFKKQSLVVKIILLIIPIVNWIVEMVVRWSIFLKKGGAVNLVCALIATFFFGNILGWIDAIVVLVTGKLLLE